MRILNLSQLGGGYEHIYLSPHLDDAALSCGGAIAAQRRAGARVLVVTVCTAAPAPQGPFSELAQEFHRWWRLAPEDVVAARLREEVVSMETLDVDYYWADQLDALYRRPQAYNTRQRLFGAPEQGDPLLPAVRELLGALHALLPAARFYAPLGIGHHVDHQITYAAARASELERLSFYEDFPYVARDGALERRLAGLAEPFQTRVVDISATVHHKVRAINAYASQLDELFGGQAAMRRCVIEYAQTINKDPASYGERLWVRGLA